MLDSNATRSMKFEPHSCIFIYQFLRQLQKKATKTAAEENNV